MALEKINRIVSEVNGLNENEKVIFLKKIERLYTTDKDIEEDPLQTVFGIWKDYDIDKETLRSRVWKKN